MLANEKISMYESIRSRLSRLTLSPICCVELGATVDIQ